MSSTPSVPSNLLPPQAAIAAQLSTARDLCRTPAGFASTLRRLRVAGYTAVQVSGVAPMDPREMATILSDEGMTCAATHEPAEKILADPDAVADKLEALGCPHTAYPYPAGRTFDSVDSVQAFLRDLANAARVLKARGITLSYHNHAFELQRVAGRLVLEWILAETDLAMEIDTYWIQAGGNDPAGWIRRCAGRLPLLHLKDYGVAPDGKPVFEEVGYGNLDWTGILAAARAAGVQWYIVEQDFDWEAGDPVQSLAMSLLFLTGRA